MTKEYISRDEMIEQTKARIVIGAPRYNDGLRTAIEVATSISAADVAPVRHGKWIFEEYELASWCMKAICSSCKKTIANNSDLAHDWGQRLFLHDYQFCPKCGADMREEIK